MQRDGKNEDDIDIDDIKNPCRDDKCDIEILHEAHVEVSNTVSIVKVLTACPACKAELIRIRSRRGVKRAMCSRCRWRGPIAIPDAVQPNPLFSRKV